MVNIAMTNEPRPTVPDDSRWLEGVGRILANLGFELVEPDHSRPDDTSHLLGLDTGGSDAADAADGALGL